MPFTSLPISPLPCLWSPLPLPHHPSLMCLTPSSHLYLHLHEVLWPSGHCPSPSQNLQPLHRVLLPPRRRPYPNHIIQTLCIHTRPLLRESLTQSPSIAFTQDIVQGCSELCLQRLLMPLCIYPAPYPLASLLPCADIIYRVQHHQLIHCTMYVSNIVCCQLHPCCFLYFICHQCYPHPICPPPFRLPRDLLQEISVCPFNCSLHCYLQDHIWELPIH